MDVAKIGKFIATCRKKANLTQAELAEKLNITDRAVSKWEVGKSLPDSAIMLELCNLLNISVNDLLTGEIVTMEEKQNNLEQKVIELIKEKETNDRKLLNLEILIGIFSCAFLIIGVLLASYLDLKEWIRVLIIVGSLIPCLIGIGFCLKIEQTAGYYQCSKCGHKYVPNLSSVFWSMHAGRTRYMKCPNCGEKSWQKKVISKED